MDDMGKPVELIGGREKRRIILVPYDHAWPRVFAEHAERIHQALGSVAVRIDHIGSTAVPGLAAKPVIDVDLSVQDVEEESAYLPLLADCGYVLRVREPGHRMVRTPAQDVHVHVCEAGSEWERRHLLFRDWLRVNEGDRATYQALKARLAHRGWDDTNDYADAKGELVSEVMTRAEAWAARTHWTY